MGANAKVASTRLAVRWRSASIVIAVHLLVGCIIEDSRCGNNQVEAQGGYSLCDCEPGFVRKGPLCEPCSANQQAVNGACVCLAGFAVSADGGTCEPVVGSYAGKPCSETDACSGDFPNCVTTSGESYCTTQGCPSVGCPAGYRCQTDPTASYCRKVTGLLKPCATGADCVGTESTYCETLFVKACVVQGCLQDQTVCPSDSVCCDLTEVIQTSLCVRSDLLNDGLCIGGKPPVGK